MSDSVLVATLTALREDLRSMDNAFEKHAHALAKSITSAAVTQERTTTALSQLTDRIAELGQIAYKNRAAIEVLQTEQLRISHERAIHRAWLLGWGAAFGVVTSTLGAIIVWFAAMSTSTRARIVHALSDWL